MQEMATATQEEVLATMVILFNTVDQYILTGIKFSHASTASIVCYEKTGTFLR
jgi:hypothetical protein